MKENKPDQQIMDAWQNDPANWRWTVFYYNPEDKRIFPPKRVRGLGWTINFGNPYSVMAFLLILAIIAVPIIYLIIVQK